MQLLLPRVQVAPSLRGDKGGVEEDVVNAEKRLEECKAAEEERRI